MKSRMMTWSRTTCLWLAIASPLAGCEEGSTQPRRPPQPRAPLESEMPAALAVPSAKGTAGVFAGSLRAEYRLAAFRMLRHPVTNRQFAWCVAVGACPAPSDGGAPAAPDAPVGLDAPEAADAYCAWIGAKLPTLEQWMHAARGSDARRYVWGNTPPDCERHPGALRELGPNACCSSPDCDEQDLFVVGKHPKGASPSGIEDVLLTRGEILRGASTDAAPACADQRPCVVTGTAPGAIDAVIAVPGPPPPELAALRRPWLGFRCVWEGGSP
jgi:hypothetical protein